MFDIIYRVVKVYYSFIDNIKLDEKRLSIINNLRAEYINSISDGKRKLQSYYVWRLLEYILYKEYGLVNEQFVVSNNGRWTLKNIKPYFSISHSDKLVAVSVSEDFDSGVDAELVSPKILKAKRIFNNISEDVGIDTLTEEWTKRECLYKFKTGNNFFTRKIDAFGEAYFITVCSDDKEVIFREIKSDEFL